VNLVTSSTNKTEVTDVQMKTLGRDEPNYAHRQNNEL